MSETPVPVSRVADPRRWTLHGVVDDSKAFWIFLEESPPAFNGEQVELVPAVPSHEGEAERLLAETIQMKWAYEAELERLREALERMRDEAEHEHATPAEKWVAHLARAALSPGAAPGGPDGV